MSLMAMVWAMHLAPVPLQRNGRRHTPSVAVLIALADRTGNDDGSDTFPSIASLSSVTGLSGRHVKTCLQMLTESGAIRLSRAPIVAVKIPRADKRPQSYDLDLTAVRYDLTEGELAHIERTVPLLRPHVALMRAAREQAAAEGRWIRNDGDREDVGEELEGLAEAVGNSPARGERGSSRGEGRSPRGPHGVNVVPARGERGSERGEPRSPEPLQEPLLEPRPGSGLAVVSPGAISEPVDNPDLMIDVRDRDEPRQRPAWAGPGVPAPADPLAEIHAALAARRLRSSSARPDRSKDAFLQRTPAYAGRDPEHRRLAAERLAPAPSAPPSEEPDATP